MRTNSVQLLTVAVIAALSLLPAHGLAKTNNWTRLAVMPFHNVSGDKAQEPWSKGLQDRIFSSIGSAQPFKYDVCESEEVGSALTNAGWKAGTEVTSELARKVASALRCSSLVLGDFSRVNDLWTVRVRHLRLQPPSGEGEQSFTVTNRSTQELLRELGEQSCAMLGVTPNAASLALIRKYPVSDGALDKLVALDARNEPTSEAHIQTLRSILESEPNCIRARDHLIESLLQRASKDTDDESRNRKLQEALTESKRLLQLAPDSCRAHLYVAACLRYLRSSADPEPEPAVEQELLAAFKAHPGCPGACRLLFPQWASQKRWEDIRTTASRAHEDLPTETSTVAWLGLALANLGERDRASELISEADASEVSDPDLHVALLDAGMQSNGQVAGRELLWLRRASATNSTASRYMAEVDASMFIKPSPYWKSLPRPRTYTKQEIQSELDQRLAPGESRLAVSPIEVTDEISKTAARLTSGLTNALLKTALLSAYVIEQRVKTDAPREEGRTNSGPELACHYYASQLTALARAIGIPAWLVHVELNRKEASGYHDRTALLVGEELMLSDPMWGQVWVSGEDAVGCRVLDDIQAIAHHLAQTNSPPVLRVALKLDPDNLWTRIVCLTKLAQQHQVEEAESLWSQLPPESTNRGDYYLARGIIDAEKDAYADALRSVLKADQLSPNNAQVKYFVGLVYGSLKNQTKAAEYLQKAMELGAAKQLKGDAREIQTEVAMLSSRKIEGDMPLEALRELARTGDPAARTALVNRLFRIGPREREEALDLLKQLADSGDPIFQENYARNALLLRRDKAATEAIDYFRRASRQGNAEAQYQLAVILYEGKLVDKDEVEASQWAHVLAGKGVKDAQRLLKEMQLFTDSSAFEEGRKRAENSKPDVRPKGKPQAGQAFPPATGLISVLNRHKGFECDDAGEQGAVVTDRAM